MLNRRLNKAVKIYANQASLIIIIIKIQSTVGEQISVTAPVDRLQL